MKTIWKYPLETVDAQTLKMPKGAEILAVQEQSGVPTLWAMVDSDAPMEERVIEIFGTGKQIWVDMGVSRKYIGTFQQPPFVWHVFESML